MKSTLIALRWLPLLALALAGTPARPAESSSKKVLAHYMTWFENRPYRGGTRWEHWSYKLHGTPHDAENVLAGGKRDISSVFYPLIGPYDSHDPDVIEYHVLSAKVAGIDGFVIDWYLPGSITDVALRHLVENCGKYQFSVVACYEEKAAFPGYRNPKTREDAKKLAIDDFTYLLKEYGKKDAYLKIDGKPVVFMFLGSGSFDGKEAVFDYMEMADIKNAVKETDWLLFREHVNATYWASTRGAYEWVGSDEYHQWFADTARDQKTKKKIDYFVSGVSPGFDSSGVSSWGQQHAVIPRDNGKYYDKQWGRAIAAHPDMIQIITWNDFQEGSVIEPTFEFGFQYLDLTEEQVSKYNGRKPVLADNEYPFKIYQLRKFARQRYQPDSDKYQEFNGQIDQAAAKLAGGDVAGARKILDPLASAMEWSWLAKIPADKEFPRFVPSDSQAVAAQEAEKLIQSTFNLARAKLVFASSGDADAPDPSKAVDGDRTTRWASLYKDGEWFKIDLGKKEKFSKIIIDWESAFAKSYSIEISDDDQQWREVYSNPACKGGLETAAFPAAEGRYIRLNLKERTTSWGFSFWEVGVF